LNADQWFEKVLMAFCGLNYFDGEARFAAERIHRFSRSATSGLRFFKAPHGKPPFRRLPVDGASISKRTIDVARTASWQSAPSDFARSKKLSAGRGLKQADSRIWSRFLELVELVCIHSKGIGLPEAHIEGKRLCGWLSSRCLSSRTRPPADQCCRTAGSSRH